MLRSAHRPHRARPSRNRIQTAARQPRGDFHERHERSSAVTAESVLKEKGSFSDRINPIVVKELRQAVQSRIVIAALLTLLSVQLVAIGIYILASGVTSFGADAGRQVFLMLFGILQVIGTLFVPLYTGARLAAERSDANVDLLFITTIKPRSVIAGKMVAAMTLTALIYSA